MHKPLLHWGEVKALKIVNCLLTKWTSIFIAGGRPQNIQHTTLTMTLHYTEGKKYSNYARFSSGFYDMIIHAVLPVNSFAAGTGKISMLCRRQNRQNRQRQNSKSWIFFIVLKTVLLIIKGKKIVPSNNLKC